MRRFQSRIYSRSVNRRCDLFVYTVVVAQTHNGKRWQYAFGALCVTRVRSTVDAIALFVYFYFRFSVCYSFRSMWWVCARSLGWISNASMNSFFFLPMELWAAAARIGGTNIMGGKTQKIVCGIGKAAASAAIGLMFGECDFVSGSLLCARLLVYEIHSSYACSRRWWHRKMCANSTHSPVVGDSDASLTTAASVVSCIGSDTQPSFVWVYVCLDYPLLVSQHRPSHSVHEANGQLRLFGSARRDCTNFPPNLLPSLSVYQSLSLSSASRMQMIFSFWTIWFSVAIVALVISSSFSIIMRDGQIHRYAIRLLDVLADCTPQTPHNLAELRISASMPLSSS